MKTLRTLIAGFFLAVVLAQGLHRHDVHEGGLSPQHVDCVLCAWSQRSHTPALSAGFTGLAAGLSVAPLAAAQAYISPTHRYSLSFPRAPPAL